MGYTEILDAMATQHPEISTGTVQQCLTNEQHKDDKLFFRVARGIYDVSAGSRSSMDDNKCYAKRHPCGTWSFVGPPHAIKIIALAFQEDTKD